jgi:hypothetical protein
MGQTDTRSCHTGSARPASPVGVREWTPGGIPRGRPASAFWHTGDVTEPQVAGCSARGCRKPAVWALRWNNPKLHTPERRKVWTACDEHRASLEDFLSLRGFLKETVSTEELA